MKEIYELKLIGNILLEMYDYNKTDVISYELAKDLIESTLSKIPNFESEFTIFPIDDKNDIVKKMVSKGVFKVTTINGKRSFSQVYNYEVFKNIFAVYNASGILSFKLPKDISNEKQALLLETIRRGYSSNMDLTLQRHLREQIKQHLKKTAKSKQY